MSKEAAMCYFYRDRQEREEALRMVREQEGRRRREKPAKKAEKGRVPKKDRELVRA